MSASFRHVVQNLRNVIAGSPGNSRLQLRTTTQAGGQAQGDRQPVPNGASHDSPRLPAPRAALPSLEATSDLAEEGLVSLAGHGSGGTISEPLDVAAAAEHHRLTSLSSSVDLRAAAVALERGLPYAILLLLLFLSTQLKAILLCAYLSLVLFRLNAIIRGEVALKQERQSSRKLLTAAAAAAAHVPAVMLRCQDIAGNLILDGRRRPSKFWDVIFAAVVGDTLLRLLVVPAKVAVLLAMAADSPARLRRRGHMLTAVEYCGALYRLLPPAPLWYHFFCVAAPGSMLQTGLSGAYLLVKAQHVFERAALAALAVRQVAARSYGCPPTPEEVQEAGGACPICQDAYRGPLKLSCGHIFCSDCCGEWFERERTCPMCRAAVGPTLRNFKSMGDGGTPLLPTIF